LNNLKLQMCWNKEVSLITYIIVIVLVIILIRRNCGADRHLAIFSAAFVTIQLMEFFAWLSIERQDRTMNQLVTRLILIFLWAQPLINSYMALRGIKNGDKHAQLSRTILIVCVILFAVLFIVGTALALGKDKFETVKGPHCHLIWRRTNSHTAPQSNDATPKKTGFMANTSILSALYIIGLCLPLLFIKPFKKGVVLVILGLGLLATARAFSSKEEVGSWWCWVAGIFTLAALVYVTPTPSMNSKPDDSAVVTRLCRRCST
jgi:hypothetical protein